MNFEAQLLAEDFKTKINQTVAYIGDNQNKFDELIKWLYASDKVIIQRLSHIMELLYHQHSILFEKHIDQIIKELCTTNMVSKKRVISRFFQYYSPFPSHSSELYNKALNFISSPTEPIAVKAFSITVCSRFCESFPELANEVMEVITFEMEKNHSAAVQYRGKNVIKQLKKLQCLL